MAGEDDGNCRRIDRVEGELSPSSIRPFVDAPSGWASQVMSTFVTFCWASCLLTLALLLFLVGRFRYLVVKPSVVVIVAFHFMIQWAATIRAGDVEAYLPNPWAFGLLAQGFPLFGLLVTPFLGQRIARNVWLRIGQGGQSSQGPRTRATLFLLLCIVLITVLFLSTVPVRQTGLYAIVFNPSLAVQAREESLKLVPNPLVRYSYNFLVSAFAPMAAVLLSVSLVVAVQRLRVVRVGAIVGVLVGLLAIASLTGARFYPAGIVLAIVVAWLLRHRLHGGLLAVAIPCAVGVVAIPAVLTVLREGNALNAESFVLSLRTSIFSRLFSIPMEMGLWHAHYAQTSGFVGVAGIPKLALLLDVEPINVANRLALIYALETFDTQLANACYVFSYYAYFGLPSLVFSLLGLWLLDAALLVYRKLGDALLLPCIATMTVASLGFVSVDYTIGLVTNGFIMALVVGLVADRVSRVRLGRLGDGPASPGEPPSGG